MQSLPLTRLELQSELARDQRGDVDQPIHQRFDSFGGAVDRLQPADRPGKVPRSYASFG